jgi:lysophospholipase L1-like esterase
MPLPRKTTLAIVTFAAFMLVLRLANVARPLNASAVIDFRPRAVPSPANETPRAVTKNSAKIPIRVENLIDAKSALTAFYRALWRTETHEPGAVTRILHYGDSPVTADSITADMRSLMQEHFGDAGHGFVLIAKPWAWYGHRGVEVKGAGWHIEPATQSRARDGFHGLGGVNFSGDAGASSHIVLHEDHARVEVQYLRQPGGGTVEVAAGDQSIGEIDTASDDKQPGFTTFPLPPGSREIHLTVKSGQVRLFGVSFERDEPGVIYNSLGLNGGQVQVVVRYFEQHQWAEELRHERPDLVIINYGTNESVFASYIDRYYAGELREVIRRVQAAVPNASLLVMSPMDRGERDSSGAIVTAATLPHLVAIQRQVAAETGCAFFDTFDAMGGAGTMARWYESQPRLVSADFMHPLPAGARKVGVLLYEGLMSGYRHYKAGAMQRLAQRQAAGRK